MIDVSELSKKNDGVLLLSRLRSYYPQAGIIHLYTIDVFF